MCTSDISAQVCTCRSGQDSCNPTSTCQPRPAPPAPPVVILTPCQKCAACISTMQPVVQATRSLMDRFAVSGVVFDACKQYWKDTPATNKDLACSQLRKDVRLSQDGNTGKRAGLICSLMSECDAVAPGSAFCNITINNTTAGSLDLCTLEGVGNGTVLQGILKTSGVWCLDTP